MNKKAQKTANSFALRGWLTKLKCTEQFTIEGSRLFCQVSAFIPRENFHVWLNILIEYSNENPFFVALQVGLQLRHEKST